MENSNIKILSTRPLYQNIIEKAAAQHIAIISVPFIETIEIDSPEIIKSISETNSKCIAVVFTSMNAVEAVSKYITNAIGWEIYCIGNTTKELAAKYFGKERIIAFGKDAEELANMIIAYEEKEVYFFCGDIRRDELPHQLKSHNIAVNEIVVYKTIKTPVLLKEQFDGILFFSPSAVRSFFSLNSLPPTTILFAIGSTTEKEIKKFSSNNIVTNSSPDKESLVNTMINYFLSDKKMKLKGYDRA